MARFLNIWSGLFAAIFLIGETLANLAVGGKPVPILLPYYVISALLIVGIVVRRYHLKWLAAVKLPPETAEMESISSSSRTRLPLLTIDVSRNSCITP